MHHNALFWQKNYQKIMAEPVAAKLGLFLLLSILALVIVGCVPQTSEAAGISSTEAEKTATTGTIVLGDVSDDPVKKIAIFQPLADYLAANLGEHGIGMGEVKIAPDTETMIRWLETGEVDLYFASPYPAMIISEHSGAQPILRRWQGGLAENHSVIFANRDNGITQLADLPGHRIGFEEAHSTSAYFLPSAYLHGTGFDLVEVTSVESPIEPEQIGYIFTEDGDNTLQWVLDGRVEAGALDSGTFDELPEETLAALTVLAETEGVARHVVLIRPGVEPEFLSAVKMLLTGMDEQTDGQRVLASFEETAQFDEFPNGAEVTLNRMKELYTFVQRGE